MSGVGFLRKDSKHGQENKTQDRLLEAADAATV